MERLLEFDMTGDSYLGGGRKKGRGRGDVPLQPVRGGGGGSS